MTETLVVILAFLVGAVLMSVVIAFTSLNLTCIQPHLVDGKAICAVYVNNAIKP